MTHLRPRAVFLSTITTLLLIAAPAFAVNPIQLENLKPGNPEWVLAREATAGEIEGYASATSVNRGEAINIYVHTVDLSYTLEIFRMGWYGGAGARRVHGPITRTGRVQPAPFVDSATGLIEARWTDPYTLTVPNSSDPTVWASGFYLVKLTANSSQKQKFTIFVVRDDARFSNHYFQSCVTTYQAYNHWGGKSLYPFNSTNNQAAVKVSYDRPYADGSGTGQFLYRWEYNMVRFLEREGYDVTYSTNVDTHRRPSLLMNHESFLSVGHDEYWSHEMRTNVENARNAGVDLGFFSANTCYWRIRFEPNGAGVLDRTMVGHKETANTTDPLATDGVSSNDHLITNRWRDTPVPRPEAALIGVMYRYNPVDSDIVIDDITSAPWVFAGSGLQKGSRLVGLLGYEVDGLDPSSPPGTIRLGRSPYTNAKTGQTEFSDMTVYTAPSGALVFATGSIQWAWGLDDWHANVRGARASEGAKQITRNVLQRFAGSRAAADCQYTLQPSSLSAPASGGASSFTVDAHGYCSYSITSDSPWLTVTSNASVSGDSTVSFSYQQNSGPSRTGILTVGDRAFVVQQASGCTYSATISSDEFNAPGGTGTVTLTTPATCPWTATSDSAWLTVTNGTSGTGSKTVTFSVAANVGPERTARFEVAGQVYWVWQAGGCTYNVTPRQVSVGAGASQVVVAVRPSSQQCHWTSSSSLSWISVASGATGAGDGNVTLNIAANGGGARSGWAVVAGNTVVIDQAGVGCTYSVSPTAVSTGRGGGTYSVNVTAPSGCAWTAGSSSPFITISGPSSGNGNGTLTFVVAANASGATRIGELTVAGNRVTVTQGSGSPVADVNNSGTGDVLFRNSSTGQNALWLMNGTTVASGVFLPTVPTSLDVATMADVDGDGMSDIVWRNRTTGENPVWLMNGASVRSSYFLPTVSDPQMRIVGSGDFNSDRREDLLWWNASTGLIAVWLMGPGGVPAGSVIDTVADTNMRPVGAADLNGDGRADIVFRNQATGANAAWLMNGATRIGAGFLPTVANANMTIAGLGDFNADGRDDILFRDHATGTNALWLMNGTTVQQGVFLPAVATDMSVAAMTDFDGDGAVDVLWRNTTSGVNAIWLMNGATVKSGAFVATVAPPMQVAAPRGDR